MFQFSGFPPYDYGLIIRYMESVHVGFPIRISADQCLFAAPRSFSQLVTSFFGSQCQGIHPVLFLLNRSDSRLAWRVQASWFSSSYTFATFVARCLPIQRFVISYKTFLGIQFLWCITDRNQRVEMRGFEPLTPCLQGRCSPN